MSVDDFFEKYEYQYDPDKMDVWKIPVEDSDGKYRGDCEDASLGVLYYVIADKSLSTFWKLLLTGKAKIHYVYNNGGHAVLQLDGMYIDNWTLDWVTKEHMESLGHKFHKRDYMFYQVALKMLNTKIRGIF